MLRKAEAARQAEQARQEAAKRAKEQAELQRLAEQARREAAARAQKEAEARREAERKAREAQRKAKEAQPKAKEAEPKAKEVQSKGKEVAKATTTNPLVPRPPSSILAPAKEREAAKQNLPLAVVQKQQEAREQKRAQEAAVVNQREAELEKQRLAELLAQRQAQLERQRLIDLNNQKEAALARLRTAALSTPNSNSSSSEDPAAKQVTQVSQQTVAPTIAAPSPRAPGAMHIGGPLPDDDDQPAPPSKNNASTAKSGTDKTDVGLTKYATLLTGAPSALGSLKSMTTSPPPDSVPSQPAKKNEILARGLSDDARKQLQTRGYEVGSVSRGVTRLTLPDGIDARTALKPEISLLQVYENYVYRPYRGATVGQTEQSTNTPGGVQGCGSERCYGPPMINWTPQLAACAKGVRVGIIDTGFDYEHPAFAGLQPRVAKTPKGKPPRVSDWHGTGVLALLAGSPHSSTPGLIHNAEYFVADAFFADSSGEAMTDSETILWALELFDRFDVQVINMSLVGPRDELVHEMMQQMTRKGVVFVAAAGNGGPSAAPAYPAAYEEVIAVTAVDHNKMRYPQANRGAYIDLAAPGVRIWTALPGRREGAVTGTSFAAPFVTAIVAATYHASPMGVAMKASWSPMDAKAETLARLGVDKSGRDRESYGRGVVTAPTTCAPSDQRALPVTQASAAPGPGWVTSTHMLAAGR